MIAAVIAFVAIMAVWLISRVVTDRQLAKRKARLPPLYESPMWTSSTTTFTTVTIPEEPSAPAPQPPAAQSVSRDARERIDRMLQEMNGHLSAARFDDALRVLGDLGRVLDELPPDQRNITIRNGNNLFVRTSTTLTTTQASQAAPVEEAKPEKVKTRFDIIG